MRNSDNTSARLKVLFLAANPVMTARLDEEIRFIEEKIRLTEYRDSLELIPKLAARPDDLLQELNRYKPQIVHFSAHGQPTGEIMLVDQQGLPKLMSTQATRALFNMFKGNIHVVVLNACYSYRQAEAIAEVIDCVIGMNDAIGVQAAIIFSSSFYRAIGFGCSIQEAFDQGIISLMVEGISEESTPKLHVRRGVDPCSVVVLNPETLESDQESQKLLHKAQSALKRGDYASAGEYADRVLEIADDDMQPDKTAQARFLLALVILEGRRPFSQNIATLRAVEKMLRLAIDVYPSYSYLLLLAMCKRDFARNGYPQFLVEFHNLLTRANRMSQTPQDEENLSLLVMCQPYLTKDFLPW